ncbi:hypothetical protein ACH4E7_39735 [Kitasatospora sp. NPDC018058]|uniref:hypothetical protein n=1 Tax=Kitasatospora sp. NPDC018058 TaxID=3364025 RepID=UPI0037C118A5
MTLFDADHYEPDEMLAHPRHLAMQPVLTSLIEQLRDVHTPAEGYEFQQDLLTRLLDIEQDRVGFKRAADRARKGKGPHADAPEPQSGRDPADPATWAFERDLCERLARQLRTVGDALAWRAFGFHRPFVIALSRNDPPGPMYGKKGLQAELDQVHQAWKEDGAFALLHDLTNCLRIGDVTIWDDTTAPRTLEIKTNPAKMKPAQLERINAARQAVLNGGPMPGGRPSETLHDLDRPLRTHLDLLRATTDRALAEGIAATTVPGSRALLIADQAACSRLGMTGERFTENLGGAMHTALVQSGIAVDRDRQNVSATSLDFTARDPLRVPWASYPLHPAVCARIIGDYMVFTVETSGPVLTRLLQAAGFDAQWVRPPRRGGLQAGEVVMEIGRQQLPSSAILRGGFRLTSKRTLQLRRSELDRYLIELVQPGTWAAGISHLLDNTQTGQPWPHYRDEEQVWL